MGGEEPGRQRDNSLTNPADDERNRVAQMRFAGLALQLAGTIVGSFITFGWLGLWLDQRFGTKPLFILIGLVLSLIAIGYNFYEIATVKFPQRKPSVASGAKKSTSRPPAKGWDDEDEEEWPVRQGTGTRDKGE